MYTEDHTCSGFSAHHEEIVPNEPNNLRDSIGEFDDRDPIFGIIGTLVLRNPKKSPRKKYQGYWRVESRPEAHY